ncbi:MAG: hypothetical protein MJ153_00880 [Clostridia bacterium]|nr:hypothetical protein [Clostridia bacterium]
MTEFLDVYSYFYIYAFIGWCVEVIYHGIMKNEFVNRGFLSGPICPVYGIGFYGIVVLLTPVIDNFAELFLGSMLITTTVELVAGFILYKLFGLRWWDYSSDKLNLGGYICLRFSIYWGIAGSFAMLAVHPVVSSFVVWVPTVIKLITLGVLSVVFILDIIATVLTVLKLKEKITLVEEASDELRAVSDRIGIKLYGHVEPVVKRTAPVIEGYGEIKDLYAKNKAEEKELYLKHRAQEKALYDKLMAQEKLKIEADKNRLTEKISNTLSSISKREHIVWKRINNYEEKHDVLLKYISELKDKNRSEEDNGK